MLKHQTTRSMMELTWINLLIMEALILIFFNKWTFRGFYDFTCFTSNMLNTQ